ncbi:hypothetical protein C8Q72DRAFT_883623 [Fomitopsis betulina]|nr:hypothetical protein C8Q72DRAFT_883623 [Fomitopsis betulina]
MAGEHPSISGRARSPSENWLAAGVRAERFTRASRPTPPAHVPSNGKPALSTPLITGRTSPDIRAWPPSLRPPIPPSIGAAPPRRPPGPSHLGGVRWRPAATTTGATMLATIRRHALRVERRRPSSSAMGRADEPGARILARARTFCLRAGVNRRSLLAIHVAVPAHHNAATTRLLCRPHNRCPHRGPRRLLGSDAASCRPPYLEVYGTHPSHANLYALLQDP